MHPHDARTLSLDALEDLRRRVVRAVVQENMSKTQAAKTFAVSRTSVTRWVKLYEQGGDDALKPDPPGPEPGSGAALDDQQAQQVQDLIRQHLPDELDLPFFLWTRQAVQALLARRFDVDLARTTTGRYLRHWGLTPQKPVRRAYQHDPKAVRHWLKTIYPRIRARAKREGGEIHWGDQMGLRSDHQAGRSYSPQGHTPVVPGTGERFSRHLMATLTSQGTLRFMVFQQRFRTPVMLAFLERLVRSVDRKVFLIVDGHPVHRSKAVQAWVAARPDQIELFELPGYSPALNPVELLNQDVKGAMGRERPRDGQEMASNLRSYLHSTQKCPQVLRRFFEHPDVAYASACSPFKYLQSA